MSRAAQRLKGRPAEACTIIPPSDEVSQVTRVMPKLFTRLIFQSFFPLSFQLLFIRHLNNLTAFQAKRVSAFLSLVWEGLTCASLTPRSGSCHLERDSSSRQCHIVGRGSQSDRIIFYHKTCRPHDIQAVKGAVEIRQMDFLNRTIVIFSTISFRCLLKL